MSDRWPDPPPLFDLDEPVALFELDDVKTDNDFSATARDPRLRGSSADEGADRSAAPASPAGAASTPQSEPVSASATGPADDGMRGPRTEPTRPTAPPESASAVPRAATDDAHAASGMFDLVAVFDLETTGVNVEQDRVVTAFVGLIDSSGAVLRSHDWLADPGIEIPAGAAAVHGITTERARADGRPAAEVVTEICDTLRGFLAEGIPLVAYNAAYDLSLLRHEAVRHGAEPIADPRPVIDPFIIDKALDRYRKGKRTLDLVAAHYGVALDDAHEASADAIAAGRVAVAIAGRYEDDLADTLEGIHDQQVAWASEQAASLTEYFVKVGKLKAGESLDGTWPVR